MKLKGFLDMAFETGANAISLSRSKVSLGEKENQEECDILTIVIGTNEYSFIKHPNGVWTRWAKD